MPARPMDRLLPVRSVLVVYKKSSRPVPGWSRSRAADPLVRRDRRRFLLARRAHQRAMGQVLAALRESGLRARVTQRARSLDARPYTLMIAIGGDGTFLEAARCVAGAGQRILGVNSDPERSAGSFCSTDGASFAGKLRRILRGRAKTTRLHRMELRLNGRRLGAPVLNDILVTHRRPAAMSRYWLRVGAAREEQRSYGLWIATAAGSTGAIRSAGGRPLPRSSRALVYRPRELYSGAGLRCRLRGGAVPAGHRVVVGSLMSEGMICADGEHMTYPFRYGDVLEMRPSARPLRVVA